MSILSFEKSWSRLRIVYSDVYVVSVSFNFCYFFRFFFIDYVTVYVLWIDRVNSRPSSYGSPKGRGARRGVLAFDRDERRRRRRRQRQFSSFHRFSAVRATVSCIPCSVTSLHLFRSYATCPAPRPAPSALLCAHSVPSALFSFSVFNIENLTIFVKNVVVRIPLERPFAIGFEDILDSPCSRIARSQSSTVHRRHYSRYNTRYGYFIYFLSFRLTMYIFRTERAYHFKQYFDPSSIGPS